MRPMARLLCRQAKSSDRVRALFYSQLSFRKAVSYSVTFFPFHAILVSRQREPNFALDEINHPDVAATDCDDVAVRRESDHGLDRGVPLAQRQLQQLLAGREIPKEQLGVGPNVSAHGHGRELLRIRREGDPPGEVLGGQFPPKAALSIADIPDAEEPIGE